MPITKARTRLYIGIDPSLRNTGIALVAVHKDHIARHSRRISLTENGPHLLYLQCNTFLDFVGEIAGYNLCSVKGICIEGAALHSKRRADSAGQIRGAYLLCCMQNFGPAVVPQEVPPNSLKKFFSKSGSASKNKMVKAALHNGWDVDNDDEADAAGLAELAWALDDDTLPLARKQLEAIKGIREMNQTVPSNHTQNKMLNI